MKGGKEGVKNLWAGHKRGNITSFFQCLVDKGERDIFLCRADGCGFIG